MENEDQEAMEVFKKNLLKKVRNIIELEDYKVETVTIAAVYQDNIKYNSDEEIFENSINIALTIMDKEIYRQKKKVLNILEKSIMDDDIVKLLSEEIPVLQELNKFLKENIDIRLLDIMPQLLDELDDSYADEIDEKMLFEALNSIYRRMLEYFKRNEQYG